MQCPNCHYDLPSKPCNQCAKENPLEHKFCGYCGSKIKVLVEGAPGNAPKERTACSDGECIGIIGESNLCITCGKPYTGPAS